MNEAGQIVGASRGNGGVVKVYDRCGNFLRDVGANINKIFGIAVSIDGLIATTQSDNPATPVNVFD